MPLTLVLGPANSAKAGEVLGAYAAAAPEGALLVVPTAADAEHYARELSAQGCVLQSVLTFRGLVEEIASRAGFAARRLSRLQRDRVVRRSVAACRFAVLDRAARAPGFLIAAGGLISELERSLVTPQRFAAALSSWARADPRRDAYARDVASIYLAYGAELDRIGRVDSDLFAWRALDSLRIDPARWGADSVFFYGFDDLHGLERDAIETLARVVGAQVTVSLTFEAGRSALSGRAELVAELRQLAERHVELPPLADYYEESSADALHHLERALFEIDPAGGRPDPGPAVQLLEAAGELAEAELVAASARELLDRGMAGEDIVVVHRRLTPATAEALARTFDRYRIPVSAPRVLPLSHTTLGRGLLGLARCALAGEDRASAQDLLTYLRVPGQLRRPEVADELEVKIRRAPLRTAAQAHQALGFELREINALREAPDQLAELVRQARRLLAAPFRAQAALLDTAALADARALSALERCAGELRELGEAMAGEELVELLGGLEVPVGARPGADVVRIADPLAIRGRRFRAVFVCGLQEGAFPWAPPPEPFLSDESRREIAAAGGLRLPLREDALDRERYLFYACVSRASERVFLSYQSSDEEGNIALASPFIDDVAEVFDPGWRARRRRRLLADVVWPPNDAPTARERERALAAAAARPADAAEDAESLRWRLGPAALDQARHSEVLSAGALEGYAACPMKWLIERELRPLELEPSPEPLERGSWMHDILEQALARLGRPVTPESLPEALRILGETMAEVSPGLAPGRSEPLRRALALGIAADLRRYLEYEAGCGCGWPSQALELRFGFQDEEEDSLPPLVLHGSGTQVALRGAIDRVDVEPDPVPGAGRRAVVRDYKSGPSRGEHQGSRWAPDRRLQVALYMIAVHQLLGLEPIGGLYQPLGGKDLRPRGIYLEGSPIQDGLFPKDARDRVALEAELDGACRRALALAASLRAGVLDPTPETCSRDGCRYPGICRAQ